MTILRYEHIPIEENGDPLVDLADYPFVLAPFYFRQGLAGTPSLFTRRAIAEKLAALQAGLLAGCRFKIWDPWRPRSVQRAIYQQYWDQLAAKHPDWDEAALREAVGIFVTAPDTPGRIPPHATGGAIDLTLVDAQGTELDMGTVFDHFGPEAARDYFERPGRDPAIRDNRRRLHHAMRTAGFGVDPDEWWHFDFGNQKWALETGAPSAFYGEVAPAVTPANAATPPVHSPA